MKILSLLQIFAASIKAADICVSVIIPCFDIRPSWFHQTITSVLSQTIAGSLEVLLVHDGDPTSHLIADKIIKAHPLASSVRHISHIRHGRNYGLSAARNSGAMASQCDWILFLDPDDWIEVSTVERMLLTAAMTEDPRVAFIHTPVVHFAEDSLGNINVLGIARDLAFSPRRLRDGENYLTSFAMINRAVYLAAGGMCNSYGKAFMEDYDFWVRVVGLGYIGEIVSDEGDGLFWYRRHKQGLSTRTKEEDPGWFQRMKEENPLFFGTDSELISDATFISFEDYKDIERAEIMERLPCYRPLPHHLWPSLYQWGIPQSLIKSISEATWRRKRKRKDIPLHHPIKISWPSWTSLVKTVRVQTSAVSIMFIVPWMRVGGADMYDLGIIRALCDIYRHLRIVLVSEIKPIMNCKDLRFSSNQIIECFHLGSASRCGLLDYLVASRAVRIVINRNTMTGYRWFRHYRRQAIRKDNCQMSVLLDIQHIYTPGDRLGWEYRSIPYDRYIDYRIFATQSMAKRQRELLANKDSFHKKHRVIYPFVDLSLWNSTRTDSADDSKIITIAFVGRLEPQKDPILWVHVCAELMRRVDSKVAAKLHFLIVGEGGLLDQTESAIFESGLSEKTLLTKRHLDQPVLSNWLNHGLADAANGRLVLSNQRGRVILLLTSIQEGLPMVLLEALALGIPTVAPPRVIQELESDNNDFQSILGRCLWISIGRTKEALGQTIYDLILNRRKWEDAKECRNIAEKYSFEIFVQNVKELLLS